jgi:hypothetical protein
MILRAMKELNMLPAASEESQKQQQEEERDPEDIEQGLVFVCW